MADHVQAVKRAREIRVGKIAFKVWQLGDGRFAFDYKLGSRRRMVARKQFADLKTAAELVAIKIINGETEAAQLSPQDCRIHAAAAAELAPLLLHVDAVARDAAEAYRIAGQGVPLRDLALFYKRNRADGALASATVAELVDRLIRSKKSRGVSEEFYLAHLRRDLDKFADQFPVAIADINAQQLARYLDGFQVGWRRRNKLRGNLVLLFRFARKHNCLSPDRATEAEKLERSDPVYARPAIFRPAEFHVILEHVREDWLPWCVIQAFTGARTEEIKRLNWTDVHWEKRLIHVSAGISKTGRRTGKDAWLPMPDNLVAWLEPWKDALGPICKLRRQNRETERLTTATGLPWKQDILRHSFGSYHAEIHGIDETLKVMRHDRNTCERHYLNRRILPEEATAWFAMFPFDRPGNIIQSGLALKFG